MRPRLSVWASVWAMVSAVAACTTPGCTTTPRVDGPHRRARRSWRHDLSYFARTATPLVFVRAPARGVPVNDIGA
ncbi:MAG TPA: hypothetical protein VGB85_07200 [Nannocystis sp.]